MWQSEANPTTTHCPLISAGSHHGCPSQSPERILWGASKHLTPYDIPHRVARETRSNDGVFPLLIGHPPAMSACVATSSEDLLGRGICSPSPRTGTLFCLSPYSHDPVSLRLFSAPGRLLFCLLSRHSPPSSLAPAFDIYFQAGWDRGCFSLCAPTLFPTGIWEQV